MYNITVRLDNEEKEFVSAEKDPFEVVSQVMNALKKNSTIDIPNVLDVTITLVWEENIEVV